VQQRRATGPGVRRVVVGHSLDGFLSPDVRVTFIYPQGGRSGGISLTCKQAGGVLPWNEVDNPLNRKRASKGARREVSGFSSPSAASRVVAGCSPRWESLDPCGVGDAAALLRLMCTRHRKQKTTKDGGFPYSSIRLIVARGTFFVSHQGQF
jgi:hypothetical protein